MALAMPMFNLAPDMRVSRLCLGTMTFGEQNTFSQSIQILDRALDAGINFFDSAEMYPVPQRAETQGRSEEFFGRWIKERKIPRDNVIFATKVVKICFYFICLFVFEVMLSDTKQLYQPSHFINCQLILDWMLRESLRVVS
nr:protein tas-like isoform X1 [Ipomoea batatas]